jgi:hypothetical protein
MLDGFYHQNRMNLHWSRPCVTNPCDSCLGIRVDCHISRNVIARDKFEDIGNCLYLTIKRNFEFSQTTLIPGNFLSFPLSSDFRSVRPNPVAVW